MWKFLKHSSPNTKANIAIFYVYMFVATGIIYSTIPGQLGNEAWEVAITVIFFGPLYALGAIPVTIAPLLDSTFLAEWGVGEVRYHHYTTHGYRLENAIELVVYGWIGYFFVALIPWLYFEDKTGVPPGVRFLANFYRHPGHAQIERSIGDASSPTFDAAAFKTTLQAKPGSWRAKLEIEDLERMREKAQAAAADMSRRQESLAEDARRRAEREAEARQKEAAYSEAELEVLKAAEELERAKARLEEQRKQR